MPNEEKSQQTLREETDGKSVEELRKLAFTDELTGLMNRRFLRNRLPTYIKQAESASSEVTLSILDLDGFKQVNDTYGHLAGDQILKTFAGHLESAVSHNAIPIRFAGDEFVAIFNGQDKKDAKEALDRLITKLQENPVEIGDGKKVTINVSIGVANYPTDASESDLLFRRADEALYYAKDAGKNRVVSYPDEGKLIAPGNISTIFPISHTVGFGKILHELGMITINRIIGSEIEPELPVVFGSRGSGKSRLLSELCKKATKIGRRVIRLASVPGNNRPYYALTRAFGEALRNDVLLTKDLAKELEPQELTVLVEDIPELQEYVSERNEKEISGDRDTLLFKALNSILFGLLRDNRALLVVDDAHDMDQISLQFLDSFLAEFPGSEIDLVFALNADDADEKEENMTNLLGNLSRFAQLATVTSFEIPPLKKPGIASMLQEVTGLQDIPEELLNVLKERSEGNPLFLEELMQLIIERGIIDYDGTKWVVHEFSPDDIPSSLDKVLEERSKRLTDIEKDVLKKASIIGETFDIRVLAEMCERNEGEVLKDLEKPRRAHIIYEVRGRENEFAFHSKSTMSVFYSMVEEQALKKAHREVADLELDINKGHEEEVYGKVAKHYQKAGDWSSAARIIATSRNRYAKARIPEATRRMLQRRAFEADMARESPLEKEDIARAIKVLRHIKVTMQALRLYPRENENVGKALDKSYQGITSFFDITEVLTFSVTSDDILVNGQSPGPEDNDHNLAMEFKQLLSPFALQGIVFTRGLTKNELEAFLEIFKSKPENVVDQWEDILVEKKLLHVRPDRKIYVALGQSKVNLGSQVITVDTATSDGSADSEAAQAALNSIRNLLDEFQNKSKELLKNLNQDRGASEEIDKLISLLQEVTTYVPEEYKAKKTKQPQEEQSDIEDITGDAFEEVVEIAKEEPTVEITESVKHEPAGTQQIETWIASLKSKNKVTRARAAQKLLEQGKLALNPCIKAITNETDHNTRQLLTSIIRRIGKSGEFVFASAINHTPDNKGLERLLSVTDAFSDSSIVGDALGTAVRNPDKEVQKAAIRALINFPDDVKCSAAIIALSSPDIEINALGIYIIGVFKIRRLFTRLTEFVSLEKLRETKNISLAITVIRSLGYFDTDEAVESLQNLVLSDKAMKLPNRIRVESLSSLGRIGSGKSMNIIKKVAKNSNDPNAEDARAILAKISGQK